MGRGGEVLAKVQPPFVDLLLYTEMPIDAQMGVTAFL